MAITIEQAMMIIRKSPLPVSHWARTVLPKWTGEPFGADSLPTTGAYTHWVDGREVNAIVTTQAIQSAAEEWARLRLHDAEERIASDARAVLSGRLPERLAPRSIDEIIQIAAFAQVRH
ncbi:hypothetical protein QP027_04975 [Corynebacterium breve]|uniref:Uncharacterized protein n=1 Tax=Corynebacterium breve TaxID=3049799 RepID=A0ABY8VHD2_9CORY|nr:hypothetical protein [Corynebacterium breve]WIM68742.1 hypothetical protein QP027_04975 [Corynebacterium breve]